MKKKYKIYTMTDLVDIWYQIKVGYFLFYWWVCEEKEKCCIPFFCRCNPMQFDSLEEAGEQIKIWNQYD